MIVFRDDPIPFRMRWLELEGKEVTLLKVAFHPFPYGNIPAQCFMCRDGGSNKQRSKIMNDYKTGEGAAATKYLGLVSIFLPHDVDQRRGSRRDQRRDPRQGSPRGAMERSSRG